MKFGKLRKRTGRIVSEIKLLAEIVSEIKLLEEII